MGQECFDIERLWKSVPCKIGLLGSVKYEHDFLCALSDSSTMHVNSKSLCPSSALICVNCVSEEWIERLSRRDFGDDYEPFDRFLFSDCERERRGPIVIVGNSQASTRPTLASDAAGSVSIDIEFLFGVDGKRNCSRQHARSLVWWLNNGHGHLSSSMLLCCLFGSE